MNNPLKNNKDSLILNRMTFAILSLYKEQYADQPDNLPFTNADHMYSVARANAEFTVSAMEGVGLKCLPTEYTEPGVLHDWTAALFGGRTSGTDAVGDAFALFLDQCTSLKLDAEGSTPEGKYGTAGRVPSDPQDVEVVRSGGRPDASETGDPGEDEGGAGEAVPGVD